MTHSAKYVSARQLTLIPDHAQITEVVPIPPALFDTFVTMCSEHSDDVFVSGSTGYTSIAILSNYDKQGHDI